MNEEVSSRIMKLVGIVEITLRNRIHTAIVLNAVLLLGVCSGNCSLKSNPDRHVKTPLAIAIGNCFLFGKIIQVLIFQVITRYTERTEFGDCVLPKPVTSVQRVPALRTNL